MKLLTALKHLINFIFLTYLLSACVWLAWPFYDQSYVSNETGYLFWGLLLFPLIHYSIIFMILFYLRKFVLDSEVGTPLDKSTRKYLKLSGIFCLIYGGLKIPEVMGLITFYRATGEMNAYLIDNSFLSFGSLFYTLFLGLFFIYLSKVLKSSDLIRQENNLTI